MTTGPMPAAAETDVRRTQGEPRERGLTQRLTETKAAFKTTEFLAYLGVLAGLLIAGAVVNDDGAGDGGFDVRQVWLYAVILTVGYMVSRGLAKSGSREPYDGR